MKKKIRRWEAILLSAVMLMGCFAGLPVAARAEDAVYNAESLAFSGLTADLTDSIALNYEVAIGENKVSNDTKPSIMFVMETGEKDRTYTTDVARVVTPENADYSIYTFTYPDIMVQEMAKTITATVTVGDQSITYGNEDEHVKSVVDYCKKVLSLNEDKESENYDATYLATEKALTDKVVVDLIKYAEAIQKYRVSAGDDIDSSEYMTTYLLDDELAKGSDNQYLYGLNPVKQKLVDSENPGNTTYTWKSVALVVRDKIYLRGKFDAASVDNLQIKVQVGDNEPQFFGEEAFVMESGVWCLYFDDIYVYEYSDIITFTFMENQQSVGKILTYSVDTYLDSKNTIDPVIEMPETTTYNKGINILEIVDNPSEMKFEAGKAISGGTNHTFVDNEYRASSTSTILKVTEGDVLQLAWTGNTKFEWAIKTFSGVPLESNFDSNSTYTWSTDTNYVVPKNVEYILIGLRVDVSTTVMTDDLLNRVSITRVEVEEVETTTYNNGTNTLTIVEEPSEMKFEEGKAISGGTNHTFVDNEYRASSTSTILKVTAGDMLRLSWTGDTAFEWVFKGFSGVPLESNFDSNSTYTWSTDTNYVVPENVEYILIGLRVDASTTKMTDDLLNRVSITRVEGTYAYGLKGGPSIMRVVQDPAEMVFAAGKAFNIPASGKAVEIATNAKRAATTTTVLAVEPGDVIIFKQNIPDQTIYYRITTFSALHINSAANYLGTSEGYVSDSYTVPENVKYITIFARIGDGDGSFAQDVADQIQSKGCITIKKKTPIPGGDTEDVLTQEKALQQLLLAIYNYSNSAKDMTNQYMHISFDDVTISFNNLNNNAATYNSLWDEPFFGWLKSMHDSYGAKFSLYTYVDTLNSVTTEKFQRFFQDASSWLKIGLHATTQSGSPNFGTASHEDGKNAWDSIVESVTRIAGSTDSLDRMPRLHNFAGSEDALLGMKEADCGALGFLTADDSRNTYYLNTLPNGNQYWLLKNDHITDYQNGFVFIKTDFRIDWMDESFSSTNQYEKPTAESIFEEFAKRFGDTSYAEDTSSYVVFGHEWDVYNANGWDETVKEHFENVCKFAFNNGIRFGFPQDGIYSSTQADVLKEVVDDGGNGDSGDSGETEEPLKQKFSEISFVELDDINNMVYMDGYSISGGSKSSQHQYAGGTTWPETVAGRCTSYGYALKVNGGETISLVEQLPDGLPQDLGFAVKAYTSDKFDETCCDENPHVHAGGFIRETTLCSDARYVLISFGSGTYKNSSIHFTEQQLELLKSCLVITEAATE